MTTQAPELFKLTGAGNSLTLNVSSAAPVPMGKYPEIEFVGLDANRRLLALRVPKASAERQLGRANLTYPDVVGKRVLFSRDPNPNDPAKAYWGLTVLEDGSGAKGNGTVGATSVAAAGTGTLPNTPPPATDPTPAPVTKKEKRSALYLAQTAWVLDKIVPMYVAAGIPVLANDVHAMVATLFIAETSN